MKDSSDGAKIDEIRSRQTTCRKKKILAKRFARGREGKCLIRFPRCSRAFVSRQFARFLLRLRTQRNRTKEKDDPQSADDVKKGILGHLSRALFTHPIPLSILEHFNILWYQSWTEAAERILLDYERKIVVAAKTEGYDGKEGDNDNDVQWNFSGSLMYSVTVITTIGEKKHVD